MVITEIGGTIGDIESQPFLEAIRQISLEVGQKITVLFIHVTLVPYIWAPGNTNPNQRSIPSRNCDGMGIFSGYHRRTVR